MGAGTFGRKLLVLEGSENPYATPFALSVSTDVGGWDTGSAILCPSGGWYLAIAELQVTPMDVADNPLNPLADAFYLGVTLPGPWGDIANPQLGGVAPPSGVTVVQGPMRIAWALTAPIELAAGYEVGTSVAEFDTTLPLSVDHLIVWAKLSLVKVR